jgi:hypothetical protein
MFADSGVVNSALLSDLGQALRKRLRRERGRLDARRQLIGRETITHALVVLLGRHALHGEQLLVLIQIDGAIGLSQRRNRRVGQKRAAHGLIRCGQVQALGFIGENALLNQAVDQRRAHLRRFEHLRVELRTEHLARAVNLLTHRAVVFGPRDLVAVDAGDVRVFVEETAETLDTHDTQSRHDDQDQKGHHQALVVTEKVEHA